MSVISDNITSAASGLNIGPGPVSLAGGFNAPNYQIFRNKLHNGTMLFDQRNVGAQTSATNGAYTMDRWKIGNTMANNPNGQQIVLGSSGAPPVITGVNQANAIRLTNSATATTATNNYFCVFQGVESYNLADLGYGTATAMPLTLSFWVYSSVPGTYSIYIQQSPAFAYTFVNTYTIPTANTWTRITSVIPGCTAGSWPINATSGILVGWMLNGATSSGATANLNSWQAGNNFVATTQTNWAATANSVFALTGCQLETGTVATVFENRPFSIELELCMRYYEKSYEMSTAVGTATTLGAHQSIAADAGGVCGLRFTVPKRVAPAMRAWSYSGTLGQISTSGGPTTATTGQVNVSTADITSRGLRFFGGSYTAGTGYGVHWDASADF